MSEYRNWGTGLSAEDQRAACRLWRPISIQTLHFQGDMRINCALPFHSARR